MAAVNAVRSKARDAVFAAGGRGFVRFLPDGEEALLVSDAPRRCQNPSALLCACGAAGFGAEERDGLLLLTPTEETLRSLNLPRAIDVDWSSADAPLAAFAARLMHRGDRPLTENGLRFAVRADQEGSLLVDFHTAKSRDTSYVTYRHYLQDAVFLAGLESEDEALLRELEAALRHPVYPLYLGRRSCPPTLPLCLGIRQGSLLDVLRTEPMQGRKPETGKLRIVADADPADPAAVPRQDLPMSFSPVHRQYGFRPVREWRLDRPEMPEPTEHDPMAELQN